MKETSSMIIALAVVIIFGALIVNSVSKLGVKVDSMIYEQMKTNIAICHAIPSLEECEG